MPRRINEAERLAELQRRWDAALLKLTPELLANGHEKQLEILLQLFKYDNFIFQCSRRAGKSWLCCYILLLVASATPNVSCLYLGLTSGAAKKIYRKVWLRLLRERHIPCDSTDSEMATTLANGSTIVFGGTDDIAHVQTLLGDSMAGGCAVVDECQSQQALIKELCESVLEPMLHEITADAQTPGKLVLAGTIPDHRGGYFNDVFDQGLEDPESLWLCRSWSRFDNPHEHRNQELLDRYLKKYPGLSEDDPFVLRTWRGVRVWDARATAFGYISNLNSYLPKRPDGTPAYPIWAQSCQLPPGVLLAVEALPEIDTVSIGADPAGTADRFTVVALGWGPRSNKVYQLAEWVTERGAQPLQSQFLAVIIELQRRYPTVIRVIYDAGSAKIAIDTLQRDYGIMIEPANKGPGSLKYTVERFADLIGQRRFYAIEGSQLEVDLTKAKWDERERQRGKYAWDRSHHPDVADGARYSLQAYFDFSVPNKPRQQSTAFEAAMKALADVEPQPEVEYGPPGSDLDDMLGSGPGYGGT